MIKSLVFVLVALAVQNRLDAAVTKLPPQKIPPDYGNLQGCYVPAIHKLLDFNRKYAFPNTNCTQYTCQKDGVTLIETCDVKPIGKGCFKLPPMSEPLPLYPDCCDRIHCVGSERPLTSSG